MTAMVCRNRRIPGTQNLQAIAVAPNNADTLPHSERTHQTPRVCADNRFQGVVSVKLFRPYPQYMVATGAKAIPPLGQNPAGIQPVAKAKSFVSVIAGDSGGFGESNTILIRLLEGSSQYIGQQIGFYYTNSMWRRQGKNLGI